MGRCEMVWTTAGTNRVCPRCLALKDKVVGHTDEDGVTLPPLHPRCRCAIMYREVGTRNNPARQSPDRKEPNKPAVDALTVPSLSSRVKGIISPPFSLDACKTFEEFKLYWAENYNVKVSEELSKLHFKSVQTAAAGVEAVLKEFPPAGRYLKELTTLEAGIMTTTRFYGKINFNPRYFLAEDKIAGVIVAGVENGFYPKNMTISGAGAHEMGHIIEDWLIDKCGGSAQDVKSRAFPEKWILEAYAKAIQTFQKKEFRTLEQLKEEIGKYAIKNPSECLATALSDYFMNGEQAALLSRTIWQRLKEELS